MNRVLRSSQDHKPSVARALAVAGLVATATAAASAPGFAFPTLDPHVAVVENPASAGGRGIMSPALLAHLEAHAAEAERWAASLRALISTASAPEAPAPVADRLLTVKEAAAVLQVSRRWLYNRAARLPFTKRLGRRT